MPLDEITSSTVSPRCMRCMLDKYLDSCPANTPCRTRSDYMRRVLRTVAEGSESLTAPEIGHELRLILRDMFGIERDFTQIKQHFNELVLGLKSQLTERMASSDDPLDLAIRCSLAGNFIDFGPTGDVDETKLLQLVEDSAHMELDADAMDDLKVRIARARSIAFLTDNCGEVVLDKLLMREIARVNPEAQITAIVRGAEASNDATLVDARQIGLNSSLSTLTTSRFTPSLTLAHRRSYPLARMRSARVTCGLR